ncbi:MAG: hypothetical protein RLZZ175_1764 [Bacteroidota bacterium]|jgi:hypothetical protein
MKLTDLHSKFEINCRQMFLGNIITGVIYGELKYFKEEDEGGNATPEPCFKTIYQDIDSLDHSIYLKTNNKTIYIFWDNTFISYGLKSTLLDLTNNTNDFEQKWDVSNEVKWKSIIGQIIVDFKIIWEEFSTSYMNGFNIKTSFYPKTFIIKTEKGDTIILSAAELKRENELHFFSDNIIVTTNYDLAKAFKIIN